MSIKLNEHWSLEEEDEKIKGRIWKRLFHCGNLIIYLRPILGSQYSVDSTRYQEYLLYIKTLNNVKNKFYNDKDVDLNLIENRLDILEGRLVDMHLVQSEALKSDDLLIKTMEKTSDSFDFILNAYAETIEDKIKNLLTRKATWSEINGFILEEKPTRPPFINKSDLYKKLEVLYSSNLKERSTLEKALLLTDYLSGDLFDNFIRRVNLNLDGGSELSYTIKINKQSATNVLINEYKDNHLKLKELLSFIHWDKFGYVVSPFGDVEFIFIADNNWERSQPTESQAIMNDIIKIQLN